MATQAPASLLSAGGKLSHRKVKKAMCQVFRKAVDDHCAQPEDQRGPFNERFFNTLQNYKPKKFDWLRNNLVREMPVLAENVSKGLAGTAMQVAAAGAGAIVGIANGLAMAYSGQAGALMGGTAPTGLLAGPPGFTPPGSAVTTPCNLVTGAGPAAVPNSFANVAHPGRAAMNTANFRLGYPDGMMNFNGRNRCIEIKGPSDTWRQGQKGTFNAVSRPKKAMEISCSECKANCVNKAGAPNGGCT